LGALAFALFFFTALFGRVWCGWACPETVFLEFLFRPIERWIEGGPVQRYKLDKAPWGWTKIRKKLLKHGLCAFFAWIIASTAIAYFWGREPLLAMMSDWPHHNPGPFILTLVMMGLMAFQFGWFREQFCTVLCPYARFQSVLMDSNTVLVGYDVVRGEPRGKLSRKPEENEGKGDCIDCGLCVRVCPTGIDIRNGVQLECINCTACIDACDSIMAKIGRPLGLIRYDTEDRLLGRSQTRTILRARPIVYAVILAIFIGAFVYLLAVRQESDFQVLRGSASTPFSRLEDGRISNQLKVRISNKSQEKDFYRFSVLNQPEVELIVPLVPFPVAPGELQTMPLFAQFPESLLRNGSVPVEIAVESDNGFKSVQHFNLLGPGA
ncbi:MAG: cytochrome c oxidase accessory protein CcoG, partial [Bdellovibrionales bacterium]|nr:cytochrome c oxidase accessory protein CcoG [Bdellovibrionales bacterium]